MRRRYWNLRSTRTRCRIHLARVVRGSWGLRARNRRRGMICLTSFRMGSVLSTRTTTLRARTTTSCRDQHKNNRSSKGWFSRRWRSSRIKKLGRSSWSTPDKTSRCSRRMHLTKSNRLTTRLSLGRHSRVDRWQVPWIWASRVLVLVITLEQFRMENYSRLISRRSPNLTPTSWWTRKQSIYWSRTTASSWRWCESCARQMMTSPRRCPHATTASHTLSMTRHHQK